MASEAETIPADALRRLDVLLDQRARVVLGVTGAPGAGKTTFADTLAEQVGDAMARRGRGERVARVPMDGFHLADRELVRLGRLERKGAPDTFDVDGYVALLRRLGEAGDEVVYAPAFERDLEQSVAGSIPVPRTARLIITEGNYLLAEEPWTAVRPWLTEIWFLEVPDDLRRRRLVARHEQFGKSSESARAWVDGVDQRNTDLVYATRDQADLVIRLHGAMVGRAS